MLKMYIDNEEVVSNNNFSIKEEILSPSSTILNNVYPKTWEQDKDYISRFYYPKDYSKFVLNKYTHINPEQGSTATINGNGQIQNVDSTKEVELTNIDGNTTQYTTTGQQLFNVNDRNDFSSEISVDSEGWISCTYNNTSGTSTKFCNFFTNNMNLQTSTTYYIFLEVKSVSGTGTLSYISNGSGSQMASGLNRNFTDISTTTLYKNNVNTKSSFDTTPTYGLRGYVRFSAGQSGSIKFRISVVATNISVDSFNYEPYTNGASPNPTFPQPINNVTGLQEVEVCGKNLFDINTITLDKYYDEDGVIQSANTYNTSDYISVESNATYTFNSKYTTSGYMVILVSEFNNDKSFIIRNRNQSYQYTFTTGNNTKYVRISYRKDATAFDIQLEKRSSATSYEPYKGNTYEINLGKNLLPNYGTTQTINGITFTKNDDGSITANGTSTDIARYYILTNTNRKSFSKGTYTLSGCPSGGSSNNYKLDITLNGYHDEVGNGRSFSVNEGDFLTEARILIYGGQTINNLTFYPQVEKGSQATSYSEYFTPIELCKIGTYQDKIFKGKGVNLLDIQGIVKGRLDNGVLGYESNTTNLTLNDNSFSFTTNANWRGATSDYIDIGNTTDLRISYTNLNSEFGISMACYDENKTWLSNGTIVGLGSKNYRELTAVNNTKYIRLYFSLQNAGTITITNPILEIGTSVSTYEPYNAKDKWLLHKEIGKAIYDGSNDESWSYQTTSTTGLYRFNLANGYIKEGYKNAICNYFTMTNETQFANVNTICFATHPNIQQLQFWDTKTTLTDWKTWLSTHNTIVYYILKNPTTTEITNSELIDQLNAIQLISGLNNIAISSSNLPGAITIHYNYVTEQHITEPIFSGIVKNTSDISLNPREPKYCSLQVLDYKTLLSEGDTLDFVITNKTILEAINMVISAISSYGFETGNINILNGNDIIGTYSTENKTAYDVLQYLADISGAKWSCRRKDENNLYIDFYDPTLMPEGKTIEYTTDWACENNLIDLTFNYGTRDYRNKQIIQSKEIYGDIDYTETLVGNSVTTDFILSNDVAKVNEVIVNNKSKTIATMKEKSIGIYADFYYTVGDNTLKASEPVFSGDVITVTYTPIIRGREVIFNDNEIDRIGSQIGVNGVIARYEDRNDETDSNKLLAIGETYLKYKGEAEITLTLKTFNSDLYQVGQIVYFNAPIQELAKNYMVKSKNIDLYVSGDDMYNVFYTYELSSSFNSERAVNWFDNQRSKTEGNIKEGSFISRNIDITSNANIIWDNVTATEITGVVGNNELNSTLDSPLNE